MNQIATLTAKVSRRERVMYMTLLIDFIFGMVACFHPHVSFADINAFIVTVNALCTFYIGGESFRQSNVDVRAQDKDKDHKAATDNQQQQPTQQ